VFPPLPPSPAHVGSREFQWPRLSVVDDDAEDNEDDDDNEDEDVDDDVDDLWSSRGPG
jgi:hypothetical protein